MSQVPDELLYTKEHEWIRIEGSKAYVGITEFAQKSLGDIVYVEMPNIDDEFEAGEEFGTVESVKAVSSLYVPVAGRIIDFNQELKDRPELINEDCYDEGWLVRIALRGDEDQEDLLSAEDYEEFLKDQ
jgi:glycine cleavage system H protein